MQLTSTDIFKRAKSDLISESSIVALWVDPSFNLTYKKVLTIIVLFNMFEHHKTKYFDKLCTKIRYSRSKLILLCTSDIRSDRPPFRPPGLHTFRLVQSSNRYPSSSDIIRITGGDWLWKVSTIDPYFMPKISLVLLEIHKWLWRFFIIFVLNIMFSIPAGVLNLWYGTPYGCAKPFMGTRLADLIYDLCDYLSKNG